MPTERQHGGAELLDIPLVTPGFRGLNTQQASGILGPEWATRLRNAVIDDNGRLSSRRGWVSETATPADTDFTNGIEYVQSDGTTSLVVCSATKFYESTDLGDTWTDITGSVVFTTGDWQLVNFNNQVWAAQSGHVLCYYDGLSTFVDVSDVNAPTGGVLLSAFGRLWSNSYDGHTVKYSALLDGTDWTTSDSGSADHWNVWPGNDAITALAQFNGLLVVFGRKSVVMWTDGQGSALGLDPISMYVVDIIASVGCRSKFGVQEVGGDLWFLSDSGIQSLGRTVQFKSNPLDSVSKHVQDYVVSAVNNAGDADQIRSVYSPHDRLFLLSLPSWGSTESGTAIVFDTRGLDEEGAARCVGSWTGMVPRAAFVSRTGTFYASLAGATGELGTYTGTSDNGTAYVFAYESGWFDITKGYMLLPKRYTAIAYTSGNLVLTFKWAFDFSTSWRTASKSFTGTTAGGEFGVSEWGIGEWGSAYSLRTGTIAASGSGKYIKLALQASISDSSVAVQQLNLYSKVGRLA